MSETPKKKTTASKTATKATATKAATAAKPPKTAAKKTNGAAAETVAVNGNIIQISREEVAMLAHSYWQRRGFKHGHHEEDWFRAEQELRHKAS
jgi:F0F1-type ATP synthase epsilon subunit